MLRFVESSCAHCSLPAELIPDHRGVEQDVFGELGLLDGSNVFLRHLKDGKICVVRGDLNPRPSCPGKQPIQSLSPEPGNLSALRPMSFAQYPWRSYRQYEVDKLL